MTLALERKKPAPLRGRFVPAVIAGLLLLFAGLEAVIVFGSITTPGVTVGLDLRMYLDRTADWLAGDGFYLPHQLAGPYEVTHGDNMYPPVLLYLTVPFAYGFPWALWWAVPLAIIVGAIGAHRPSPWQWIALAAILVYPRTWTILLYGNPALWAFAFLAAGCVWKWPAAFVPLKLTLAPFALVGVRDRHFWYALWAAAFAAIPFGLIMWVDYFEALANAETSRGLEYTLGEWPIAVLLVLGLLRLGRPEGQDQRLGRDADIQRA